MKTKKGYLVRPTDEIYGIAVVATSAREAKKIAYPELRCECEFIDMRVSLTACNEVVSDLPIGILHDDVLTLKRGIFSILSETKCEGCGNIGSVQMYKDQMLCDECLENIK